MHSTTLPTFQPRPFVRALALTLIALSLTSSGCITAISNLLYVIKGRDLPAEYSELAEKRVAVVVTTPAGTNADVSGLVMARQVHTLLSKNVKKIKMVHPEEVDEVVHDQPSGSRNMARLGERLGVDYIVAVDLKDLELKEGATLYRGKCDCSVAVYQIGEGDRPVFRKDLPPFVYPETGLPVTDVSESKFRGMYLTMVSERVARTFYPYDPINDVALDASAHSIDRF
jgi:hypothetical protein